MTIALVFIGIAAGAALVGVLWLLAGEIVAREKSAARPQTLTGRTLVVHTRAPDDQTLRGILIAEHADRLTLRDVVYVHKGGESEVGGLVHVLRINVAWAQEIEA